MDSVHIVMFSLDLDHVFLGVDIMSNIDFVEILYFSVLFEYLSLLESCCNLQITDL